MPLKLMVIHKPDSQHSSRPVQLPFEMTMKPFLPYTNNERITHIEAQVRVRFTNSGKEYLDKTWLNAIENNPILLFIVDIDDLMMISC